MCDVTRRFVADVVEGRNGAVVEAWVDAQKPAITGDVGVVVSEMSSAYGRALRNKFPDATYVVDRFHVVQAANKTLDDTRWRVWHKQKGYRGSKDDPLYRSRKLGQIGEERLDRDRLTKFHELLGAGDPHGEVLEAWAAKEEVRKTYDFDPER